MHKHLMTIFTTTVSTFLTVSCSTSAQNMDHNRTDSQHAASLANASPSNLTSSNTPPSVTGPAAAKSIGSEVGTGTEASTPLLIAGHNYSKVTPPSTQQGDGLSNLAASPPLVGGGNTPATLNTDSTVSGLDPNLATTPLLIGVGPTGTRNPSMPSLVDSGAQGLGALPQPIGISLGQTSAVSSVTDGPLVDAVLECGQLLPVTSFSLKTTCQVFSNTGTALELRTVASAWKWSATTSTACTAVKAERANAGYPTIYELTFFGSSVTPCMTTTVVTITINPKSGGTLMLQASPN